LPLLSEVYGDHWESIINNLQRLLQDVPRAWDPENENNESLLPLLYVSLKLLDSLRGMSKTPDCNEDLIEALENHQDGLPRSLVSLLTMGRNTDDSQHQPFRIVNDLLCRALGMIDLTTLIVDLENVYPLLAVRSNSIQETAFKVLHSKIPAQQQEMSMEIALGDTKIARLPDELLSLIIDAPPAKEDALIDWLGINGPLNYDENLHPRIKCYLLSWVLLFDHFTNAVSSVSLHSLILMLISLVSCFERPLC
jgi:hypothetical protein